MSYFVPKRCSLGPTLSPLLSIYAIKLPRPQIDICIYLYLQIYCQIYSQIYSQIYRQIYSLWELKLWTQITQTASCWVYYCPGCQILAQNEKNSGLFFSNQSQNVMKSHLKKIQDLSQNVLKYDLVPDLSHFGTIWTTFVPNPTSLLLSRWLATWSMSCVNI